MEGFHGPESHSPCKQHGCLLDFTLGSPKSRVLAKKWGADGALLAEQCRQLLRVEASLRPSAPQDLGLTSGEIWGTLLP